MNLAEDAINRALESESWAREKLPLAITPMTPYLRYAGSGAPTASR